MKALTYARYGGPEVLELTDLPLPKVPPGWVLVQVRSAAIIPVDWRIMAGGLDPLMETQFPVVPGWDVSFLHVVEMPSPVREELPDRNRC